MKSIKEQLVDELHYARIETEGGKRSAILQDNDGDSDEAIIEIGGRLFKITVTEVEG